MELMRLHADECEKRWLVRSPKEIKVTKVGLNVFVDGEGFYVDPVHGLRSHAPDVGNRAVRHEAAAVPFYVAAHAVFARLDDYDTQHQVMIVLVGEWVKL